MTDNGREKPCTSLEELRTAFLNQEAQYFDEQWGRKLRQALELAEAAHSGQTRDDNTPYILHPLRIALSLMQELDVRDAEVLCAALLHDVAEDQERFTPDDIEAEFGGRVGSIVRTLTKPDEPGITREEVNKIYFERLRFADEDCKLVKLADKLDNVRDAINSPDPNKRQRTAEEAKNFYVKELLMTLLDNQRRQIMLGLFNRAIEILTSQTIARDRS
jgi:(p)ppGpp synthase/HD superfamily hydrolase